MSSAPAARGAGSAGCGSGSAGCGSGSGSGSVGCGSGSVGLVHSARAADVRTTIVDGRVLMRMRLAPEGAGAAEKKLRPRR
ncbi:hypothetical protein [Streptomyces sp. NPDC008092]|uniref:hypothetical protein n=1 Tax=Streptomyces sp. NPDC008092 TaxID=3364808 RepID=UPI0036E97F44